MYDGSVWIEKGSSDPRFDAKLDANCVRYEADRMPGGEKKYLHEPYLQNSAKIGDEKCKSYAD